tara:strand:+ start:10056 stop:11117 length:1062 start_codon:yes stop_codon:yes gene_type:complete
MTQPTKEKLIEDLKSLADEGKKPTRGMYRNHGDFSEHAIERLFGSFTQFKQEAGLMETRGQRRMNSHVARHVDSDRFRKMNVEKVGYEGKYLKPSGNRFQTVMVASDLHDIEMDRFWRRVFLDSVRRIQPDIICFGGDVFDLPEFGKYDVDPRDWDVVGRIKYQHEFFRELREIAPDTQIDLVEGNHEFRLLRHLGEATPALKSVLSDLHGFTIGKLLGLDEFEIRYIARSDLAATNKSDISQEVGKNYEVYFDSLMIDHFPSGKDRGLSGYNGHHHKFKAETFYSHLRGPQTWIQLGAGHKREAEYCDGEKWTMGFSINHIDTQRNNVVMNYVPILDFAEVGGMFYFREKDE